MSKNLSALFQLSFQKVCKYQLLCEHCQGCLQTHVIQLIYISLEVVYLQPLEP